MTDTDDLVRRARRMHEIYGDRLYNEIATALEQLKRDLGQARQTAQHWKDEHIAGNRVIEQQAALLRERDERIASKDKVIRNLLDATDNDRLRIAKLERELAETNFHHAEAERLLGEKIHKCGALEIELAETKAFLDSEFDAHQDCHKALAEARRDAERYRALRDQMTWCHGGMVPVLGKVSKRVWYHATDDERGTLDAVSDAAREKG